MHDVVQQNRRKLESGFIPELRTSEITGSRAGAIAVNSLKDENYQRPSEQEGIDINWRTVSGRRGHARVTARELEWIQQEDAPGIINFLALDMEEEVNAVDGEPEFLFIEICLDSGAGDHVLSRLDIPGFTVEESPGSKAGRHFTAAGGKGLRNEGQALLHLMGNGDAGLRSTFQVAEVTRPRWSVGKICDQGYEARFTKKKAAILNEDGKETLSFERRNGLYLGCIKLRNPKFKPKDHEGFARPSA